MIKRFVRFILPPKVLYRTLSSAVENSVFDDGPITDSERSVQPFVNLNQVVPSKAIEESLRDGIPARPATNEGNEDEYTLPQRDWASFVVVYTMIFFNGCCFTAVVPSVPFYLEVLGAAPSFLGWVVSFYSLGQIIGSAVVGSWLADKLSSRRMLTMTSILGVLSSTMYATAPTHWFVLLSRLLTGISAGMEFTTELAFIGRNTTITERTTFLASVTAVNVVGFIIGPALTTVLATFDFTIFGLIAVNQYTGPGWLLVVMFVVDIIMVQTLFEKTPKDNKSNDNDDVSEANEKEVLLIGSNNKKRKSVGYGGVSDEEAGDGDPNEDVDEPPPSLVVVFSLIVVQFTVMCAWSVLETITSPLAEQEFGWDVRKCNLLFTFGGFVSLLAYVGFVVASKWVQDRYLIAYALVLCFIGLMLMIDWSQLVWMPSCVAEVLQPYLYRFVAGYFIMNAGFMTGRPVTFALYSKLMPSQYQGKYLGWMVAGGSAARTLGPFAAVYLYYGITGPGNNMLALFGIEGLFQLGCLVLLILLWKCLLPATSPKKSVTRE